MKKNISFTCPNCGGHQLLMVEIALSRFDILELCLDENQQLRITEKIPSDSLRGEVLGYRCKSCRYPDANKADLGKSFGWTTMDSLLQAGAITWQGYDDKVEHKCMLCQDDGSMTPLLVTVNHPGRLTAKDRDSVIMREGLERAILICQSDPGIKAFDCKSWSHVKRHQICFIHPD